MQLLAGRSYTLVSVLHQDFEGRPRQEFPDFFVRFCVPLHAAAFFSGDALVELQKRCEALLVLEPGDPDGITEELPLLISGTAALAVLNASMTIFDTLSHPHVRCAS